MENYKKKMQYVATYTAFTKAFSSKKMPEHRASNPQTPPYVKANKRKNT